MFNDNNNHWVLVLVFSYLNYDRLAVGLYGVFDIVGRSVGVGTQKCLVGQRRQQQRIPLIGSVISTVVVVVVFVSGQEQRVRTFDSVVDRLYGRCRRGRRKFRRRRRRAAQVHVTFGHRSVCPMYYYLGLRKPHETRRHKSFAVDNGHYH